MWVYRLLYVLKSTRRNVQDHAPTLIMSVTAAAFTLLLFALYVLLLTNLQSVGEHAGELLQITLYLEPDLAGGDRRSLQERVEAMSEVEKVVFCTPEQALASLRESLGATSGLLANLPENPLPASLEVRLKPSFQEQALMEALAGRLRGEAGVEAVEYGGEWIARFFDFVRILRWLGGALGLLLLGATVIVISSTLSLGFYARKEEIEILRLVGASESYVKLPFFWEAMLQGTGGALLALGILWVLYQVFRMKVMGAWSVLAGWVEFQFLSGGSMLGIILLGAFVGGVSCLVSFSRFSPRP